MLDVKKAQAFLMKERGLNKEVAAQLVTQLNDQCLNGVDDPHRQALETISRIASATLVEPSKTAKAPAKPAPFKPKKAGPAPVKAQSRGQALRWARKRVAEGKGKDGDAELVAEAEKAAQAARAKAVTHQRARAKA